MLKGATLAFLIMIAGIPIPIVHFILVPIGPFLGGFFGGGIARADEGKIITFGFLVAALMFIPVIVILIFRYLFGINEILGFDFKFVLIAGLILIPYTWFGVTIGALISYLIRKN